MVKKIRKIYCSYFFEKGDSYKKKLIAGEIDPSMRDIQIILSVLNEMC